MAELELNPMQLLFVILKAALKDRITDKEAKRICRAFYSALASIWGDEEE